VERVEPGEREGAEGGGEPRGFAEPEPGERELTETELAEPVAERYSRLGAEGVRRLRARYGDIKARLLAREMEAADRTVALTHLERLNPDAWLTDEAVARALEEYESVFEAIRPLVGRQPRRR
jgi:hypothetical protein